MVGALFLKNTKDITNKMPQLEIPPTEKREKSLYFHHIVERNNHILWQIQIVKFNCPHGNIGFFLFSFRLPLT